MFRPFKNTFKRLLVLSLLPLLQWSCTPDPELLPEAKVDQTQAVTASESAKKVFAHYMVCCPAAGGDATVEDFKKEITAAQTRGIDGFALNSGGWDKTEPHYKRRALQMYEAAKQLGTGFQLFISADQAALAEVPDMITTFRDHPNQFRHNGKLVVSTFAGEGSDNTDGQRLIEQVHSMGAVLVPYFYPRPNITELPQQTHADQLLSTFPNLDGYFYFGAAGTPSQISQSMAILANTFTGAGKIFMAGITPYYRANGGNFRVYETRGFEGMAQEWETAIKTGSNWVELVTWNDWAESSYLAPFDTPDNTNLWDGHFGPKMLSHVAYLDASRYYIDWFKTGSPPAINQDKLYYFYRLHPKSLTSTVDAQGGATSRPSGADNLVDEVFVTVFLTQPAKLVITTGSQKREFDLAAGVKHVAMPFSTGKQHFALYRDTKLLISKFGEHDISATDTESRFNYFSGSASSDFTPTPPTEPTPTEPTPTEPTVPVVPTAPIGGSAFTVVDAINDRDLVSLANGATLSLSALNFTKLNIRYNSTTIPVRGSAKFELTGTKNHTYADNAAPYAVFGDDGKGNYYHQNGLLSPGQYTLKVTPYSNTKGKGTAGTPVAISFTVVQ